jgi:hypothetical protein
MSGRNKRIADTPGANSRDNPVKRAKSVDTSKGAETPRESANRSDTKSADSSQMDAKSGGVAETNPAPSGIPTPNSYYVPVVERPKSAVRSAKARKAANRSGAKSADQSLKDAKSIAQTTTDAPSTTAAAGALGPRGKPSTEMETKPKEEKTSQTKIVMGGDGDAEIDSEMANPDEKNTQPPAAAAVPLPDYIPILRQGLKHRLKADGAKLKKLQSPQESKHAMNSKPAKRSCMILSIKDGNVFECRDVKENDVVGFILVCHYPVHDSMWLNEKGTAYAATWHQVEIMSRRTGFTGNIFVIDILPFVAPATEAPDVALFSRARFDEALVVFGATSNSFRTLRLCGWSSVP